MQDEHFIECIREGKTPRTDGASGLAVVRVLEAASCSLRTGHEVPVDAGRDEFVGANDRLEPTQMEEVGA